MCKGELEATAVLGLTIKKSRTEYPQSKYPATPMLVCNHIYTSESLQGQPKLIMPLVLLRHIALWKFCVD